MLLFWVFFGLALLGEIWLLWVAFQDNVLWGVLIILFPPLGLVYALMNFETCKVPLVISTVGAVGFMITVMRDPVGAVGGEHAEVRERGRPVAAAARTYHEETGEWPENVQVLVSRDLLEDSETLDPWGHELQVDYWQSKLRVWSVGPDGDPDTADDNISFSH